MKRALVLAMLVACKFDANDGAKPIGGDAAAAADATTGGDGPDACAGVPAEGTCTGTDLARCVDGAVQHETCSGACVTSATGASCVDVEVCAGVGPLGRCDGDTLARCDGGVAITDCAATGQVCAYTDDTAGYACVAPAATGAMRVTGTIRWEDRKLDPGVLGPPVATPARGTMVAVVDGADATLATASTSDDGTYVLRYDAPAGTQVRVVAYSRSRATVRPARVRDASGYLHALGGTAFTAGATGAQDLLVQASADIGGAWNALDNAVTAMDWLRARGATTIAPVIIYWQLGSATGSYYQGADNTLHLDGDDGFDDVVTLHELGHYVQDEYAASDNPGGAHDGSPADPRLAWGEGSATWFALAVRGVPYYIDYSAGGGWSVELETKVHAASPTGGMTQNISEWMVAELMYDLSDAPGGDNDPVQASIADVLASHFGYLRPPHADRGVAGVDLVDFLDGWFARNGTSTCAAMQALAQKYHFPYDFAACP